MNAVRGIVGLKVPTFKGQANVIKGVVNEAKARDLCRTGGKVAVIAGAKEDSPDDSNIVKVLTVA